MKKKEKRREEREREEKREKREKEKREKTEEEADFISGDAISSAGENSSDYGERRVEAISSGNR